MTSENAQTPPLAVVLIEAARAGDWPRAASLMTTHWVELQSSHRDLFAEVMREMPADFIERNPALAASRAYSGFFPDAGAVRPTRFQETPAAAPSSLMDVLSSLTARSAAARMAGDHPAAVAAATDARGILTDATPAARAAIAHVLPDICVQWAISHLLAGDITIAYEIFAEVYDGAVTTGNTRMAVEAAGNCALILSIGGTDKQARDWLDRMPSLDDPTDTVSDAGRIAAAFLAIDGLDRTTAEALARELVQSAEVEHWALRLLVHARIAALWRPDTTVTLSALLGAVSAHPRATAESGLNAGVIGLAEAELRLRAGDHVRARGALDRARSSAADGYGPILDVVDARILALTGHPIRARAILAEVLSRDPLPRIAVTARLVRSALVEEGAEADREAVRRLVEHTGFEAVRAIVDRETWEKVSDASPEKSDGVFFAPDFPAEAIDLTRRERFVLRQVLDRATVAEIAEAEGLSPHTIKKQLLSAYRKIGVGDRAGAIAVVDASPWILSD